MYMWRIRCPSYNASMSAWRSHTRCEGTYSSVSALPNRFRDAIDCASHPALRHPTAIRRNSTATRYLAVNARTTVSAVHHFVKHIVDHMATVEWEAHADEWVVKEATAATTVRFMAAIPTPRVMEKWVRHGMM